MKNSLTKGEVDRMYRAILGQLPRTVEAEVAEPLTAALESLRQVKINDDVGFSAAAAELAHTAVASPRAMTVVARLLENLPRETSFYDQVRQGTARALGLLADRLGDVSQIAANALAAHLGDPPGGEATIALQRLIPVDPPVQEAIYRAISRFPWLWECVYLLLSQMPPAQVDVGRWLECRHPAARAVGIVHLGRTRPTSGLMQQMLRAAIADRSYIVRCSAVLAVVRAPINTVGRDVLASALYDRHPHVLAAWYANVCQGRDARWRNVLVKDLGHFLRRGDFDDLRAGVAASLGSLGKNAICALADLEAAAQDHDPAVREAATNAITRILGDRNLEIEDCDRDDEGDPGRT